jgi:hypothetical protein
VRVSAFLSGGYVPRAARGGVFTGLMHIADWYTTLARLAGIDAADDEAVQKGLPAVDGVDQWDFLTVPNGSASARSEVPLSFCTNIGGAEDDCVSSMQGVRNVTEYDQASLIADGGRWKVVFGDQHGLGFFTSAAHPNGTADYVDTGCPSGCLFELFLDPTEHIDRKKEEPAVFLRLKARLEEIGRTVFQTNYSDAPLSADCISVEAAADKYNGHIGPQCFPANTTGMIMMA